MRILSIEFWILFLIRTKLKTLGILWKIEETIKIVWRVEPFKISVIGCPTLNNFVKGSSSQLYSSLHFHRRNFFSNLFHAKHSFRLLLEVTWGRCDKKGSNWKNRILDLSNYCSLASTLMHFHKSSLNIQMLLQHQTSSSHGLDLDFVRWVSQGTWTTLMTVDR